MYVLIIKVRNTYHVFFEPNMILGQRGKGRRSSGLGGNPQSWVAMIPRVGG